MDQPPQENRPQSRAYEVVRDVDARRRFLSGDRLTTLRCFFDCWQGTDRALRKRLLEPEDAKMLASHLNQAKQVSVLTLPHATHFIHLDRPERGRAKLIEAMKTFLGK